MGLKRWIVRARAVPVEGRLQEDKLIVISGRKIETILPSSTASRFSGKDFVSSKRYLVLPGLVDMHCHGGGGMDPLTRGGLLAAAFYHASHGTAAMLLSVFYEGPEKLAQTAALVQEIRPSAPLRLLGLHLEGPYINSEVRGSIPESAVRPFTPDGAEALLRAGQGELKMITLAPELPGAEAAVRAFRQAGVVVAMGHSLATVEQAKAAADWGATVVTHMGNAMRPFHQREPGLIGAGMTDSRLFAEVIGDGQHLAPETLDLFVHAKTEKTVLISDCRWVGGLPEGGEGRQGDEIIRVQNGAARQPDGTLAGGVYPLWKGVSQVAALPNSSLWLAARLATQNPARALGRKHLGQITIGGRADLILTGPGYSLRRVFISGEEIFRSEDEPPLPDA